MALVNPKKFLKEARNNKKGVCALNAVNLETMTAIVSAADEVNTPVIVQCSEGAIKYAGLENLASIAKNLGETYKVDFALHLDHGSSLEMCKKCIDADFTMVMLDLSKAAFDENVKQTKELVKYAHRRNVFVEAELGRLFGKEDNADDAESVFTNPALAHDFILKTGVDALAISVGTSHGAYKLQIVDGLKQNIIKQIAEENPETILVLHGASHIDEDIVKKINALGGALKSTSGISLTDELEAIKNGITKINIDSDLRLAYTYGVRKFLKENGTAFDIRNITGAGISELKAEVSKKLNLFSKQ